MPLGRPVDPAEVRLFAKARCNYCQGSGNAIRIVPTKGPFVRAENGVQRVETLCGCAMRRFLKVNREKVIVTQEGAFWLSDEPVVSAAEATP